MGAITIALINTAGLIVVAVLGLISERERKATKRDLEERMERDEDERKRVERRAAVRAEESRLSMQMMDALLDLCFVTSLAVTGGHTNGNVEEAQNKAQEAKEEYTEFIQSVASKQISKV